MAPRFEIVSAPLEQRMQTSLEHQARLAVENIGAMMHFVEERGMSSVHKMRVLTEDKEFITSTTSEAINLMAPTSLPGFLLLFSMLLKTTRWFMLSRRAHRAVRESNSSHVGNDKKHA
jgi:hypothetical protein